jgi:hypothetical protein
MKERIIRAFAGSMVLASVALAYWIHPYWIAPASVIVYALLSTGENTRPGWCWSIEKK